MAAADSSAPAPVVAKRIRAVATSGKSEVEAAEASLPVATSGKSDLPPIEDSDSDIELQDDIRQPVRGWRLEQNSNRYWRWRYQEKDDAGNPVTYINKSGKRAYRKGSRYVKLGELDDARETEARLRSA